jgi:site-specific recombinase XerC
MSDLELAPDTAAVTVEAPVRAGDPLAVYLARLTSPESRRAMAGSLEFLAELLVDRGPATAEERRRRRQEQRLLASHIPWHRLRYAHTQALRSWLAEHCSPAAANRHLAALRGVLREAWRLGLMNGEDLARAIDLASIPSTNLPAGRYVEDGEVRRLVAACLDDDSPGGRRDAAVLAVLFAGGLRRAEAVALDVDDYDAQTRHLTVTGKGRRQRRTALPAGGRRAMTAWLEVRGLDEPGPSSAPSTRRAGSRCGASPPRPSMPSSTGGPARPASAISAPMTAGAPSPRTCSTPASMRSRSKVSWGTPRSSPPAPACAMRPPMSAVPPDRPPLTGRPQLTSTFVSRRSRSGG